MKHLLITAAAILASASFAQAASIERVGAKVEGASTWVNAIRFVSQDHGMIVITTEDVAKGRTIPGAEVVPAGTFNPASMASSVAYIQARFGVTPGTEAGGSSNGFVTSPGPDGVSGTADDTRGPGNRDRDHW